MGYPIRLDGILKKLMESFQLTQLPIVAMREVIQFLTIPERIKLALTSKKMKRNIIYTKPPKTECIIQIRDKNSFIYLKNGNLLIYGQPLYSHNNRSEHLEKDSLRPWLKKNGTTLENIVKVSKNVSEIVKFTSVILVLKLELMNYITVQQVLSVLDNWKIIVIDGRYIKWGELNQIMDKADNRRSIAMNNIIPPGFDHKNMFKFYNIRYGNASWVQIHHLLSLRNKGVIVLKETMLRLSDINSLIKEWIENDFDMFKKFDITQDFYADNLVEMNVMLQDCVWLETNRNELSSFLVCANPTKVDRKWKILNIFNGSRIKISLHAYSPDENAEHRGEKVEPFTKEFEILIILNEIKRMEEELKSIDSVLLTDIEGNQRKKLIKKRGELKREVETRRVEIENEGAQFEDGIWKMIRD